MLRDQEVFSKPRFVEIQATYFKIDTCQTEEAHLKNLNVTFICCHHTLNYFFGLKMWVVPQSHSMVGIPYPSIGLSSYDNLKQVYLFIEAESKRMVGKKFLLWSQELAVEIFSLLKGQPFNIWYWDIFCCRISNIFMDENGNILSLNFIIVLEVFNELKFMKNELHWTQQNHTSQSIIRKKISKQNKNLDIFHTICIQSFMRIELIQSWTHWF